MNLHQARRYSRLRGFTLTEILIVLVILALLAAFGLPAFLKYGRQGRLVIAQASLKQIARQESQWFAEHKTYATLSQLGYPVDSALSAIYLTKDGAISASAARDSIYRVSVKLGTPLGAPSSAAGGPSDTVAYYLITAEPVNEQVKEAGCGTLSLASTGQVGATGLQGEAACWDKK
jgi:prepilin-type N-terminal cleavage/methylation domain-containing protein